MRYLVITEHGNSSWGPLVPDPPGCIAVGDTEEEVLTLIGEAIDVHLELLRESGKPVPPPRPSPHMVDVVG
jgi:predicted RNase H-like HicB family nuclease